MFSRSASPTPEKIVREEEAIFGELPDFEPGHHTLIADYLPWAEFDGMEHRNSTALTSRRALATNRVGMLREVAHEFFHCWNVKRIRPAALEPYKFEDANISVENQLVRHRGWSESRTRSRMSATVWRR